MRAMSTWGGSLFRASLSSCVCALLLHEWSHTCCSFAHSKILDLVRTLLHLSIALTNLTCSISSCPAACCLLQLDFSIGRGVSGLHSGHAAGLCHGPGGVRENRQRKREVHSTPSCCCCCCCCCYCRYCLLLFYCFIFTVAAAAVVTASSACCLVEHTKMPTAHLI